MKIIKSGGHRLFEHDTETASTVSNMLFDLEKNGMDAVRKYSRQFDQWDPPSFRLRDEEVKGAISKVSEQGLEDTDYSGRVDAKGEVTLNRLLPGPYNLIVIDTLLEPLGIVLRNTLTFEAVRDSTLRETVEVSTAQDYVADRCRHDGIALSKRPGAVWMIGRVIGPNGAGMDQIRASVSEGSSTQRARNESSPFALIEDQEITSTRTGTDGIYELCQGRFVVGDSVIVTIRDREGVITTFPFALKDSLTVLPMTRVPKRP